MKVLHFVWIWSSLVEGAEPQDRPNSQTRMEWCHVRDACFVWISHKQNSLPLGPIQPSSLLQRNEHKKDTNWTHGDKYCDVSFQGVPYRWEPYIREDVNRKGGIMAENVEARLLQRLNAKSRNNPHAGLNPQMELNICFLKMGQSRPLFV